MPCPVERTRKGLKVPVHSTATYCCLTSVGSTPYSLAVEDEGLHIGIPY